MKVALEHSHHDLVLDDHNPIEFTYSLSRLLQLICPLDAHMHIQYLVHVET